MKHVMGAGASRRTVGLLGAVALLASAASTSQTSDAAQGLVTNAAPRLTSATFRIRGRPGAIVLTVRLRVCDDSAGYVDGPKPPGNIVLIHRQRIEGRLWLVAQHMDILDFPQAGCWNASTSGFVPKFGPPYELGDIGCYSVTALVRDPEGRGSNRISRTLKCVPA